MAAPKKDWAVVVDKKRVTYKDEQTARIAYSTLNSPAASRVDLIHRDNGEWVLVESNR